MKKKLLSVFMIFTIVISVFSCVEILANEDIKVSINGKPVYFDQPPILYNDRTLVPVRAIFEAMGATVLWDENTEKVSVFTDFGVMILIVNNPLITYQNENEDRSVFSDVPPMIINNRTLVPVRAIAECTGYKVDWDDSTQTVIITGNMEGITLPNANISSYYQNTNIPDFGICLGVELSKNKDNSTYSYTATAEQLIDYIETYLAGAGFLIDSENELWGMFTWIMSNASGEKVKLVYIKPDKHLDIIILN